MGDATDRFVWANMRVRGKTWRDMLGNSEFDKRCLFALWRRGYLCDGEVEPGVPLKERIRARAHATRRGEVRELTAVIHFDW
jgi:hypothetical protein